MVRKLKIASWAVLHLRVLRIVGTHLANQSNLLATGASLVCLVLFYSFYRPASVGLLSIAIVYGADSSFRDALSFFANALVLIWIQSQVR